ncbi:HAD family hydrolase [Xanthomonas translucens]|uniref:HAD family hydrolase n=3 Tax=Xanthomonas campestris pv. translucens TaxID=343 RepID=A0A120EVM5_XANCT|nr:HAD-IA family hydrolase [Xanthomonas translucens]KWV11552.1 HAD family hydrolase [Xanthomonas translucens]MCC8447143.1 HAD-IA family hydrolase [Xanthomonas translucens pv. translucens]MCT8287237.1 HAD-IA family hydrolase [Xanthomonas translucens pv. translucens]MCT8304895.1 HAD-IA family hydrolase [Xanthomonas translucens pv. translucens]QSQ30295.1 HAD family hydrolase [Xanthomonas translucens pv. translucens]
MGLSVEAPGARLRQVRHWVFDMDGTLTRAVHDFALIRRELQIPQQADILQHLAALPAEEAAAKHAWLLEHERELAFGAVAAPGAPALLRTLHTAGCRLAVLTRNAQELARLTLREIGVEDVFEGVAILGRDEAPPKPHPGGLQQLAAHWGVAPHSLAMIGDHEYDLQCGRHAGATTVLLHVDNRWPALADLHFADCAALLEWWRDAAG